MRIYVFKSEANEGLCAFAGDADGNKFPVEKRMALCRCGASTEKPFCDGTHSKIGFKAAEKAVPESKE